MSGFIPVEYAILAIGLVAIGAALFCLRVVGEAIDAAVRRHDLRVEAGHLRIEQARKLDQLRMQSEAVRSRSRRRSPPPSEPVPDAPAAQETAGDGETAPGNAQPAMKQAA